ncbi:hypothetical protein F1559_001835 [Cyanidiococcus yangmingshanensis]|uniref:BPL/LPL catalytic domain-containing protein n=1 Tax=Cyanidiococcus yangmingshanensis TaxID=2690220 RepID=A0A7J7IFZ6_9RHOD|nr:hypothetical protein F1559_001835 [Cyanidiococcus yangmingshanensis]
MSSDKLAMPRRLLVYCDSVAWRQRFLEMYAATLVRLRDAGYLVQLPFGWEPEREDTKSAHDTNWMEDDCCGVFGTVVLSETGPAATSAGAAPLARTYTRSRTFARIDPDGTVVVADRQLSGRGRRGASWDSPSGSLAFSVQCDLVNGVNRPLQFVQYIAGLALIESIPDECAEARHAAEKVLRIKWPNDIFVDGLKVAGILCESSLFRDRCTLYVGIGVNVANTAPTMALARLPWAASLTRETLLARFLVVFEHYLGLFVEQGWQASGLGALYTARWLHHDQRVLLADSNLHGRIIGLSEQGCLLVELDPSEKPPDTSFHASEWLTQEDTSSQLIEIDPDVTSFDWQQGIVRRKP